MKEKKNHLQGNYGPVSLSKNMKKNLPMLIASHCSSKAQKLVIKKGGKSTEIAIRFENS